MVEGGACNHSRLQRCIRKSRSLQQRMQQQEEERREQEEELQRRYQPITSSQRSAQPGCWVASLGEELSPSCDHIHLNLRCEWS